MMNHRLLFCLWAVFAAVSPAEAATNYPPLLETDYVIRDFHFRDGGVLPELRMHYRAFGTPRRDAKGITRNAVLILHGTTGKGEPFLAPQFAGELFGPGQLLDVSRYYVVIPDNLGHGASSKPSDGLHARFPNYGYLDMIEAQYRLLTEGLGVNHARLIMGTSMGGMHTWLWGELHPDFMDALMPLASQPTQISGRNREWRRIIIDAIRIAPDWNHGDYTIQPKSLAVAAEMLFFMTGNPVTHFKAAPTLAAADTVLDAQVASAMSKLDANDVLYAVEASRDYDPAPGLGKIIAPLLAVNTADDLINPPELRVLEAGIKKVPHGTAIVIPFSDETVGHASHTKAVLWEKYLARLLRQTERAEDRN